MNTVERIGRAVGRIPEGVKYFVTKLGADWDWGGKEEVGNSSLEIPQGETLLKKGESFNPREKINNLLRIRLIEGALTIGTLVTGSVAISRLEESLGWNHNISQLIFSLIFHPWR